MIVFIYGDNIVESRNKLIEFNKENYPDYEIMHLDDCPQVKDFQERINSTGFFSTRQVFILENFFKGKTPKWKTEVDFRSLEKDENIFVFCEETLNVAGKKAAAAANKKNIYEFKLPNLLWNFLDGITPSVTQHTVLLKQMDQILKTVDANYIFLMIVRQFRLLILTKEKYRDYPSDYKRLTFQKYKLAKQASFFTSDSLRQAYKQLLKIEARQKSGTGIYNLKTEIEKFLLNV